jgi:hypothetical protein
MPTPADMRERFKRLVWRYRHIPGDYGLRPYTVDLVSTTWTGAQAGEGARVATTIRLTEANGIGPKVRYLKSEELALGNLSAGSIVIGPITPDFTLGGTTMAALMAQALAAGGTFHVVITGPLEPNGTRFVPTDFGGDHALHYSVTASPVGPL